MYCIEATDLSRIYQQGDALIKAVDQANFRIAYGEFVSISGRSGSGKTTLLNLLGCIDQPTAGHILIDGVDVTTATDDELAQLRRTKIGFIHQSFDLIPVLTAYENIIMPAILDGNKPKPEYVAELVKWTGLTDRLQHFPHQLSGGQQQRVAIARALINRPSIILADEPTGSLDKCTSDEIIRLLIDIHHRGTTLLLVTHESEYAAMAARRFTIEGGIVSDASLTKST